MEVNFMRKIILTLILLAVCTYSYADIILNDMTVNDMTIRAKAHGVLFDGTDDSLASTSSINIAANIITISVWFIWDSYGSSDDLMMEFSPNYNSNPEGFYLDPDGGSVFEIAFNDNGALNRKSIVRPSAEVWHHLAIVLDNSVTYSAKAYVDGVAVTVSDITGTPDATNNNFGDQSLFIMSRNSASLFGDGKLTQLAIWSVELTATEVAQLAVSPHLDTPGDIQSGNLVTYIPMNDVSQGVSGDGVVFRDDSGNGETFTGNDGAGNDNLTGYEDNL